MTAALRHRLDEEETREVVRYLKAQGVAAIAVCTLFSFINPVHEERIEEIIHEEFPEAYVTISSKLAPEFREFSRMSTTVIEQLLRTGYEEVCKQLPRVYRTARHQG